MKADLFTSLHPLYANISNPECCRKGHTGNIFFSFFFIIIILALWVHICGRARGSFQEH